MTRGGVIQPYAAQADAMPSSNAQDHRPKWPNQYGLPAWKPIVLHRLRLPGYVCGRRLGGGPTCHVYLATNEFGQSVAVKLLNAAAEQNPSAVELLRREAIAGMAVAHSNVVRIVDAHVARSPYFLVMDCVPGTTAKDQLYRHGPFPVSTTLGIIRQVADGLTVLHRAGFIHGDVKPSNIMLPRPGQATLIDLGFAHRPGELKPWTDRGNVIGTANYLAPELARLPIADAEAADLYSLGVTCFEMLTGFLPYPGRSTAEVVRQRAHCLPAQLPNSFPPSLRRLIATLTEPRASERPNPRQLVHELAGMQIAEMKRAA